MNVFIGSSIHIYRLLILPPYLSISITCNSAKTISSLYAKVGRGVGWGVGGVGWGLGGLCVCVGGGGGVS